MEEVMEEVIQGGSSKHSDCLIFSHTTKVTVINRLRIPKLAYLPLYTTTTPRVEPTTVLPQPTLCEK